MRSLGGKQCGSSHSAVTIAIAAVLLCMCLVGGGDAWSSSQSFNNLFTSWAGPKNVNVSANGQQVKLILDRLSAAGFYSKNQYLFGSYGMWMKLPANDSAGTVTTFYLSSQGPNHDEFDFEFLGNSTGQPYVLHTNIFSNGVGGREIQFNLWFDPRGAFHYYNFQWNQDIVVFYVDNTPIRTFKNCNATLGVPFPNKQPVGVYASIWDGSAWATEGGRVKLNWTSSPFIATYENFNLKGCVVGGTTTVADCQNSTYATPGPAYQTLSHKRVSQLKWVKKNWVKYNYCADKARFQVQPPECQVNIL